MSRTYNAHADVNLEARVVLVTLGGRAPVALTMPAARDLLNSLTAAIAAQDARDAANDAELDRFAAERTAKVGADQFAADLDAAARRNTEDADDARDALVELAERADRNA